MPTTELFAEILVIGLLATPWVLLGSAVGGISFQHLPDFHGWEVLGTAIALSLVYALGIIVDRVADLLTDRWDETISDSLRTRYALPQHNHLPRPDIRFRLIAKAPPSVVAFLDYARSRRRILRGVALNALLLAGIATVDLIHLGGRTPSRYADVDPAIIVITSALFGLSLFAWWHIGKMYFDRSLTAYRLFVLGAS